MFKALRPSSWGLKLIDVIVVLIVIAVAVKFFAPTSGLSTAIHTVCSWLAIGVTYIADWVARFLNWI